MADYTLPPRFAGIHRPKARISKRSAVPFFKQEEDVFASSKKAGVKTAKSARKTRSQKPKINTKTGILSRNLDKSTPGKLSSRLKRTRSQKPKINTVTGILSRHLDSSTPDKPLRTKLKTSTISHKEPIAPTQNVPPDTIVVESPIEAIKKSPPVDRPPTRQAREDAEKLGFRRLLEKLPVEETSTTTKKRNSKTTNPKKTNTSAVQPAENPFLGIKWTSQSPPWFDDLKHYRETGNKHPSSSNIPPAIRKIARNPFSQYWKEMPSEEWNTMKPREKGRAFAVLDKAFKDFEALEAVEDDHGINPPKGESYFYSNQPFVKRNLVYTKEELLKKFPQLEPLREQITVYKPQPYLFVGKKMVDGKKKPVEVEEMKLKSQIFIRMRPHEWKKDWEQAPLSFERGTPISTAPKK